MLPNSLKTYLSGYACEILIHDLRMGYARYFSSLPISEIDHLNAESNYQNYKAKLLMFRDITIRMSDSEPITKLHELTEEERAWLLVKKVCVEDLHAQSVLSEAIWL